MRLSIRWKLTLAIGLPLLVFVSIALTVGQNRLREEAFEQTRAQAAERAAVFAARFDSELTAVAQVARSTALFLSSHHDLTDEEVYEIVSRNVLQHELIYGSCVAYEPTARRARFAPYAYTPAVGEARSPAAITRMEVSTAYDYTEARWDWYVLPRQTGEALWTEPFFDEGAGNVLMCTYSAPFFGPDGKFRGVATVDVPLERLAKAISFRRLGRSEAFIILSRKGVILSSENKGAIGKENAFEWARGMGRADLEEMLRRMVRGETGTARLRGWGVDLVTGKRDTAAQFIYFALIPSTGWSFAGGLPEAEIMAPVYARVRDRALVMASVLAVAVCAALLLAARITRPVSRLSRAVRDLAGGNLDARVSIDSSDEIGDLARAFNTMTKDLRRHVAELTDETARREAVESELRVARQIQESLLPGVFPPFPERMEFSLHAMNAPARHIAGDFFDFFFVDQTRLALVMADVSGKGAPAAVFMAVARTVMRDLARQRAELSPGALLTEANRTLLETNASGMFVTLWFGVYDTATGEMRYANAGHPHPYLLREASVNGQANGAGAACARFGEVTGPILGALEGVEYADRIERLNPGDTLVFFTDGVHEARKPAAAQAGRPARGGESGGEFFGLERLERLLVATVRVAADTPLVERLCTCVVDETDRFQSNTRVDDVTVMALQRAK